MNNIEAMNMLHDMGRNIAEESYWSQMYREVASHFEGDVGTALFDYYDAINRHFFNHELPQAFLLKALTAYGRCIGLTKPDLHKKPIILIHPTLKTEKERFYVVLHEAIHVHVRYNLHVISYGSKSSHSIPEWISEVNRIAKMLGYIDVILGENKVVRVKGERVTKRIASGTVSYACTCRFPWQLEQETGQMLPSIEQWLQLIACNKERDV